MTQPRHPLLLGVAAGIISCVIVSVIVSATLNLMSDRSCPEGQAPATNPDVTSRCFTTGSHLPTGYTWDPGGNR